jgi:hypothetical protein
VSVPLAGVHRRGLIEVVSVQSTTLSAPEKQASRIVAEPPLRVACPAQFDPDDIEKPPIGLHEVIVVAGGVGSAGTWMHPVKQQEIKTRTHRFTQTLPPAHPAYLNVSG